MYISYLYVKDLSYQKSEGYSEQFTSHDFVEVYYAYKYKYIYIQT